MDKRLTLLYRPPFAVRSSLEPVIVDADGEPIALALPGPTPSTQMLLAEAIAAGLNAQCSVPAPAIAAPLAPHHVAAVRAESRQQAERMNRGRLPDAAE